MSTPTDKSAKPEMHGHSAFPAATSLVGVYGEQLFRILEQTSSGYILLDSQNRAQRWNDGYLQLFPWLAPALKVGAPLITTLQAAAASAPAASAQTLSHIAENHHSLIARKQASIKLLLPSGRKVSLSAHTLSASYTVLACKELLDAEDSGEGLAFFDTLTNLPNRRLLLDRLSQAMIQSERTGWRGALLTIDMEATGSQSKDFLCDSQAHLAQLISQRLLSCVRACDTVARLDEQHFVIMVSDLSPDIELANLLVERLGDRLQESLNAYYQIDDRSVTLEANIGATLFGPHSRSATELLQQAEMAMYRLRDGEHRGLHFFNPEQQIQTPDRNRMELDLREALRLSQFELHYQPQYSTRGISVALRLCCAGATLAAGLYHPVFFSLLQKRLTSSSR